MSTKKSALFAKPPMRAAKAPKEGSKREEAMDRREMAKAPASTKAPLAFPKAKTKSTTKSPERTAAPKKGNLGSMAPKRSRTGGTRLNAAYDASGDF